MKSLTSMSTESEEKENGRGQQGGKKPIRARKMSLMTLLLGTALVALEMLIIACAPAAAGGLTTPSAAPQAFSSAQASAAPTSMPTPPQPNATDATAAPKAYIGLFKDNAVAVLDTGTDRVLKSIPIPAGPHGLVITPDGRWVYASSDGDSKVSVIDTSTDTVKQVIEVGQMPHGLAITPDGKEVLVAVFGTSTVAFVDTATNQVVAHVAVPNPHNIAVSPDGHTAYVAAQKPGAFGLTIFDVGKRTQIGNVPLDKTPRALNFSPDGKELYFTEAGVNAVQVLDTASNGIKTQIPVGASPHHPLFTPDGKEAMVVAQGPGELDLIDPATNAEILPLKVGQMPHWIAVTSDGRLAYVTNESSGDVSVVDLNGGQVLATIPVGHAPRKIVVQPGMSAAMQRMPTQSASSPSATSSPSAKASANLGGSTIRLANFAFSPKTITVKLGEPVKWTNNDVVIHTVTSDQGIWNSGDLPPGGSFTFTFEQPGTYAYHCSYHPYMQAVVIVIS